MPDMLTRRNGTWHFVRRVPAEYAAFDSRRIIRHSTRIKIQHDRAGRRAVRIAETLNRELERHWRQMAGGQDPQTGSPYDSARPRARELGFEYLEAEQLLERPLQARLERLEALSVVEWFETVESLMDRRLRVSFG